MAIFTVGQMVKLISHHPERGLPRIGAIGTIMVGEDAVGDYEVLFHGYPCTVEDSLWIVPGCQLAPLKPIKDFLKCAFPVA